MSAPQRQNLSQKQLLKLPLFHTIRQINGQKIFNQLHQNCIVQSYESRYVDKDLNLKQKFIYVKEGQVLIYKVSQNSTAKSLIKSYRAEEYCGFQDYPLYWGEGLIAQVNDKTTIILVPLKLFYKFFRRVLPMIYLQSKAQFLKKLPHFRNNQLQTIFKLACISQKYRVLKQQIIIKEGDPIQNIYIVCSGKFQLKSSVISQFILCGPNQNILLKQVGQNIPVSCFEARCIQESDILAIPKHQYKKLIDIPEKPQYIINTQKQLTYEDEKSQQSLGSWSIKKLQNHRIKSAKIKTESVEYIDVKDKQNRLTFSRQKSQQSERQTGFKRTGFSQASYSLGEIQLLKFIKRKQKIENRNFFKYIESRAPQIVINPSKQFALVKPFYNSSSQYVRNMKRKIKHSVSITQNSQINGSFNDFLL